MINLFDTASAALSWTASGGKLTVLIYHRALARSDPLLPGEPDEGVFGWQMEVVARHFRVLPLGDAVDDLVNGRLAPRSACITFDDGYTDNYTVALPILRRLRLSATFFVATGFLDGGRMWNDTIIESVRRATGTLDLQHRGLGIHVLTDVPSRRTAIDALIRHLKYRPSAEREALTAEVAAAAGAELPTDLMMTSEQVAGLADAGMEIGAHTVTHSLLKSLDDAAARHEVRASRSRLREITGRDVAVFAYPNGRPDVDYGARDVGLIREAGFAAAVSTAWGAGTRGSDRLQVPRFTPWDRTPNRFLIRLIHNYTRTNEKRVTSAE